MKEEKYLPLKWVEQFAEVYEQGKFPSVDDARRFFTPYSRDDETIQLLSYELFSKYPEFARMLEIANKSGTYEQFGMSSVQETISDLNTITEVLK